MKSTTHDGVTDRAPRRRATKADSLFSVLLSSCVRCALEVASRSAHRISTKLASFSEITDLNYQSSMAIGIAVSPKRAVWGTAK